MDKDSDQFAQCNTWSTSSYDYGDGIKRKSEVWSCTDFDGKDCDLVYDVDAPHERMATSCEGTPKTGVPTLPYKDEF
jgi:hypothetical protein